MTLGQSVGDFTEVAVHVEGGPSNQRLLGTAHIINPQADNRYKFPMGDTGNTAITASLLIESGTRLESERTGAEIVRVVGYK